VLVFHCIYWHDQFCANNVMMMMMMMIMLLLGRHDRYRCHRCLSVNPPVSLSEIDVRDGGAMAAVVAAAAAGDTAACS